MDNPDLYSSIANEIDGVLYEIGGKNKDRKQLKSNLGNGYIVKDDILYGSNYEIPLLAGGYFTKICTRFVFVINTSDQLRWQYLRQLNGLQVIRSFYNWGFNPGRKPHKNAILIDFITGYMWS